MEDLEACDLLHINILICQLGFKKHIIYNQKKLKTIKNTLTKKLAAWTKYNKKYVPSFKSFLFPLALL